MAVTDPTAAPGSTQTYRVRATRPARQRRDERGDDRDGRGCGGRRSHDRRHADAHTGRRDADADAGAGDADAGGDGRGARAVTLVAS